MPSSAFHLRPVSAPRDHSPSSSSSDTVSDRTPPPHRRPLSPSSLRDLDLDNHGNMPPRKYPAPPTGHELMALFPPPPPINVRSGPTSGYFQREERAFFAQAGKEIVRVQFEVDLHPRSSSLPLHNSSSPQEHHPQPPHDSRALNLPPVPFANRTSSTRTGMITPIDVHTRQSSPFPPPPTHAHLSGPGNVLPPPQQQMQSTIQPQPQDGVVGEEDRGGDDAWRRPMPHSQRRRAGKHTKRVVVK